MFEYVLAYAHAHTYAHSLFSVFIYSVSLHSTNCGQAVLEKDYVRTLHISRDTLKYKGGLYMPYVNTIPFYIKGLEHL